MVKADKILSSNAIFTGLEEQPKPGVIAIKGNKIIAVGTKSEIEPLIDRDTEEFHFNDQLIMAGFYDAHIHLMLGSLYNNFSINLSEAKSENEVASIVKEFADERPEDDWIIGNGWDQANWENQEFPNCSSLDKVISDRSVLLIHAEGHYAWVNSKAMEVANITKQTEDPSYGIIQKDDNGDPTGLLIESAMSLATDKALDLSPKRQEELLDSFLKHSASFGVTSINDMYASRAMEKLADYNVFKKFDEQDRLTTRIHLYPALDGDIENAKELQNTYNSSKLKVAGLKQFIDGVVTGYTAYMLDPYVVNPQTYGEIAFSEDQLREWILEADKEGFQIRLHTIGDGAVRLGLDIIEEAKKQNNQDDLRHALEHVEVIHPSDIPRFESLGAIPSIQPIHISLMPRTSHTLRVQEEKYPYLYPSKSFLDTGANLAFGTDFPISPLNPMLGIYRATTRMDYSDKEKWNEHEKVSIAEALKAYTYGAAFSAHRENELGTIEEGKLADIVVLDQNIFNGPKENILNTKVELTMMDGEVVYNKELIES